MKWVRCPSCRTVNDIDRYATCDGCNRDLADVVSLVGPRPRPSAVQGARDSTAAGRFLWVIAAAFLVGTFLLPLESATITGLISVILLAILFITFGVRSVRSAGFGPLGQLIGILGALVLGLGGALFLVFVVCSVNPRGL